MSTTTSASWPAEQARQARFLTPKALLQSSDSSTDVCVLCYNAEERLLAVMSCSDDDDDGQSSSVVLDVIDVDDMIGAKLSVELNVSAAAAAAEPGTAAAQGGGEDGRASNEPATDQLVDRQGSAVLTLFTYPRKDPAQTTLLNTCCIKSYQPTVPNPQYTRPPADPAKLGNRLAFPRTFTVAPAEDLGAVSAVTAALQRLATPGRYSNQDTNDDDSLNATIQKPPTYLILVNPRSGSKRNGQHIATTIVQPMLAESGVESDLCVTTHAGHASERCQVQSQQSTNDDNESNEKDLLQYDGLILMGGDGIIHEALQGIMSRPDAQQVLQKLTLGMVGCGTSNGMATSICHASRERYGPVDETYLICKGQTLAADLSSYQTTTQQYTSFLTFSWGIIADIDIESERLHFLGQARFDVWGVLRVLFLRRYRGRLSYRPVADNSNSNAETPGTPSMPATLSEAVPSDWQVIEDDFLLFWASHVTHAGMTAFHSPKSTMQDGIFQIMVVRGGSISRYRMARILLGIETGSHADMPGVEFIPCTAYRLEPLSDDAGGSFNDLDGEVIEEGPIQGQVLPAAMKVFGTPV